jgi:hypothetical protein
MAGIFGNERDALAPEIISVANVCRVWTFLDLLASDRWESRPRRKMFGVVMATDYSSGKDSTTRVWTRSMRGLASGYNGAMVTKPYTDKQGRYLALYFLAMKVLSIVNTSPSPVSNGFDHVLGGQRANFGGRPIGTVYC